MSVLSCLSNRVSEREALSPHLEAYCDSFIAQGHLRKGKGQYVYQFIQTLLCHAGTMCNDTGVLFLCLSLLFMCS